jgi:hypothetical protein
LHLSGCASRPALGDPALIRFLDAAGTGRDEVVALLGSPISEFELDHIVIYGLGRDRAGYFVGWSDGALPGGQFHLVIEFNEQDVVRRYTVVDVEADVAP